MITLYSLPVASLGLAATAGAAATALPLPVNLFAGLSLGCAAAVAFWLHDHEAAVPAAAAAAPVAAARPVRPPRSRPRLVKPAPARELVREPDPLFVPPPATTLQPFRVPEAHDLPEFVRQPEASHVFSVGDRVRFVLVTWEHGEEEIEGDIVHDFITLGFKVVTDDGRTFYPPTGSLIAVGDGR